MVFCIQDFMANSFSCKKCRQMFWFFNRNCADKNRLSFCMSVCNFFADSIPFVFFVEVNFVLFVLTLNRAVCWNYNNIKLVNFIEFDSFCGSRTSHSWKFWIHAEKILEGNGSHCAVAVCNADVLFCFNSLMQTVAITAAFKNTSCKFVYNFNFSIADKVVNFYIVKFVCTYSLCKVVNVFKILFIKDRALNDIMLYKNVVYMVHSWICKGNTFWFFIKSVVTFDVFAVFRIHFNFVRIQACFRVFFNFCKFTYVFFNFIEFVGIIFASAGNNQWSSCFINENWVDFIYDCKVKATLNFAF